MGDGHKAAGTGQVAGVYIYAIGFFLVDWRDFVGVSGGEKNIRIFVYEAIEVNICWWAHDKGDVEICGEDLAITVEVENVIAFEAQYSDKLMPVINQAMGERKHEVVAEKHKFHSRHY